MSTGAFTAINHRKMAAWFHGIYAEYVGIQFPVKVNTYHDPWLMQRSLYPNFEIDGDYDQAMFDFFRTDERRQ